MDFGPNVLVRDNDAFLQTPKDREIRDGLSTEEVPCNLCLGQLHQTLYTERYQLNGHSTVLGIKRCLACDLVFVSPRLTLESVSQVYASDTKNTISHRYCWEQTAATSRFRPILERIHQVRPSGRLLDVGCGAGDLLEEAGKFRSWQLFGLDPSPQASLIAAERVGCQIYETFLEQLDVPDESFSVMTLLGVLEHLHDPRGTLERVHQLLQPGGVVGIYVPNFDYLKLKDAGLLCWLRSRRWSNLHPQEHQFQFTQATVTKLLEQASFEVLRVDVGQPFLRGSSIASRLKLAAFSGVKALHHATGIHMGGLEIVARKIS